MRVWRVHDEEYATDAWTGEGARLYGGRWNEKGAAVVYTSDHAALAILEVMAGNLRDVDLRHFRLHSAHVPDDLIRDMPAGGPAHERTARWLATGELARRVPSTVAPGANVLLNPASPDWGYVRFHPPIPIEARLHGRRLVGT